MTDPSSSPQQPAYSLWGMLRPFMFKLDAERAHRLAMGSLSMAWYDWYLHEEENLFGQDPFAYGLERNSHVISKFLSYCYDLGVCENKLCPQDLFHASTWKLEDS